MSGGRVYARNLCSVCTRIVALGVEDSILCCQRVCRSSVVIGVGSHLFGLVVDMLEVHIRRLRTLGVVDWSCSPALFL